MTSTVGEKKLTDEECHVLEKQNTQILTEYQAKRLECDARKNWDKFYKRNEDRFFKDRHWTLREFKELSNLYSDNSVLLEIGCGVGNFIYPLIDEGLKMSILACDLSQRAVNILKAHPNYDINKIHAFCSDITTDEIFDNVERDSVDVITLIFMLSSISPEKFRTVLRNTWKLLKAGGRLLLRDYGLYDMAQLRFKPGRKISDNFYMRQDGTRAYYFSIEELSELFHKTGFKILENKYVHRRTVNKKEKIDVGRVFVQTTAVKPS